MSTSNSVDWRSAIFASRAPGWSILIRLIVGLVVFFPEGIQKLAFPEILGAGRFANIGIPFPDVLGPFVGTRRDDLRRAYHSRPFHPACRHSADRHHDRRNCFNKSADPARARVLDFSSAQTGALRLLEHDARGARRLRYAAWIAVLANRGRWKMVARRAALAGRSFALTVNRVHPCPLSKVSRPASRSGLR